RISTNPARLTSISSRRIAAVRARRWATSLEAEAIQAQPNPLSIARKAVERGKEAEHSSAGKASPVENLSSLVWRVSDITGAGRSPPALLFWASRHANPHLV